MVSREEITRLAQEAGFNVGTAPQIERFAVLIAAAERERIYFETSSDFVKSAVAIEREACAMVCDQLADMHEKMNQWSSYKTADTLAQAIRARSQP